MTSSSSLPSFPSTLSWSRDESTRRVKYLPTRYFTCRRWHLPQPSCLSLLPFHAEEPWCLHGAGFNHFPFLLPRAVGTRLSLTSQRLKP